MMFFSINQRFSETAKRTFEITFRSKSPSTNQIPPIAEINFSFKITFLNQKGLFASHHMIFHKKHSILKGFPPEIDFLLFPIDQKGSFESKGLFVQIGSTAKKDFSGLFESKDFRLNQNPLRANT